MFKDSKAFRAGRALIYLPLEFKGIVYNAILLTHEGFNNKFSLPGGRIDTEREEHTLDAVIRELREELGLHGHRETAEHLFSYDCGWYRQDVYRMQASGTVHVNLSELNGIGFIIDDDIHKLSDRLCNPSARHVTNRRDIESYSNPSTDISILEKYLYGRRIHSDYKDRRENFVVPWEAVISEE